MPTNGITRRLSIPFSSTRLRQPYRHLWNESALPVEKNNNFGLTLTLPAATAPFSDIVVVVNGYGEVLPQSCLAAKHSLCPLLADHGLPSLIVPIPFHLNRLDRRFYRKHPDPAVRSLSRGLPALFGATPERIYFGYDQLVADLLDVAARIHHHDLQGLTAMLTTRPNIHLFGYSWGGLGCLAAVILSVLMRERDTLDTWPLFKTCTMLCSGVRFGDIDLQAADGCVEKRLDEELTDLLPITIDGVRAYFRQRTYVSDANIMQNALQRFPGSDDHLATILGFSRSIRQHQEHLESLRSIGANNIVFDVFQHAVSGMEETEVVWRALEVYERQVCQIFGGSDRLAPPELAIGSVSGEPQFHQLVVKDMPHQFHKDGMWVDEWRRTFGIWKQWMAGIRTAVEINPQD